MVRQSIRGSPHVLPKQVKHREGVILANETAMPPGQLASRKAEAGMGLLAGFLPLT